MPKRTDIQKILILGAGPIVIGQACEFDYSGTQACKALREEGYEVVLVNSNPATIMTDPDMADRTYIEPVVPSVVEQIIAKERPDAILPTLGGQTGLNVGLALFDSGALQKYNCQLIGATRRGHPQGRGSRPVQEGDGEDRPRERRSGQAHNLDEARAIRDEIGLPCVLRPSFTLGGSGGGIAYNREEFDRMVAYGLELSPVGSILIEESLIGWKEFEMEVMRDRDDNAVIVCSIENFDPMGVHTGDSHHRRPGADAHGQGIPAHARRLARHPARDRRRDGRVERPVRDQPEGRADDRHRDEPARQPQLGLASKATGLPDRQDRRQAGRRLHAGRDPQRHHARDPRVLRADDRLRRHEDPPLGVREVPRGRPGPHHADEVRRRGDGDRPHLPRVVPEGPARPGDRPVRLRVRQEGPLGHPAPAVARTRSRRSSPRPIPTARSTSDTPCWPGCSIEQIHALTHIDPWFLANLAEIVATRGCVCARRAAWTRRATS